MKTIYISGPITNVEGGNQETFTAVANLLHELGYAAINPHNLFTNIDTNEFTWDDYMRGCIIAMMQANEVVTLDGWEQSKGAVIEVDLARKLSIPVTHIVKYETEARRLADKLEKELPAEQPAEAITEIPVAHV